MKTETIFAGSLVVAGLIAVAILVVVLGQAQSWFGPAPSAPGEELKRTDMPVVEPVEEYTDTAEGVEQSAKRPEKVADPAATQPAEALQEGR